MINVSGRSIFHSRPYQLLEKLSTLKEHKEYMKLCMHALLLAIAKNSIEDCLMIFLEMFLLFGIFSHFL